MRERPPLIRPTKWMPAGFALTQAFRAFSRRRRRFGGTRFDERTCMQTQTAIADPIELLMEEHRLIERVLDALDARTAEPARFVAFLGEFADGQHHGKEEEILFRAMIEAGVPQKAGPIAVMLHEHDLGRALMDELATATTWTPEGRRAALNYSALLRQHIQKEDRILYPMAKKILGREMAAVAEACSRFTHAHNDARLRALAEDLIARR